MATVTGAGAGQRFATGVLLGLAAIAYAQPIRIPDFRESPRVSAAPKPGEACNNCGVIRAIREVQSQRAVTAPKTFQAHPIDGGPGSTAYVGAVIALPLGAGAGAGADKPFVGGIGTPEMRERFTETSYEIVVRLDSGGFTLVPRRDGAFFRVGDRVRVQGTQLELLAP